MNANDSITKGLAEALAFAEGQADTTRVHQISVPDVDVADIRQKTGLSQIQFARSIGVAKGTLVNWEHGRRKPTGPAQVLLALISRDPDVVQSLLR